MKVNVSKKKNIKGCKRYKYINGTKGIISLFLALMLLPFTTVAGSLVNAARVDSAVAIFDEALCNASNSTLGTYDSFLRKRFGLLAMSQDVSGTGNKLNQYTVSDLISETFEFYLEQNLGTLSNTYVTSESDATGVYPLADTDILLYQVLEYSKYSVPTKLVEDSFSISDIIASFESQIPGKGIFDLITSGVGAVDSMVTLAEDFELLKTAVNDEEIALTNYQSAYQIFSGHVSRYVDKKTEMEIELAKLQTIIDQEQKEFDEIAKIVEDLEEEIKPLQTLIDSKTGEKNAKIEAKKNETDADKINQLELEIKDLESELASLLEQIAPLNTEYSTEKSNYDEQLKELNAAVSNYNTTKASYEQELALIKTDIESSKSTYSSSISTLISKLKSVQSKLTAVQKDIAAVGTAAVNFGTTATKQTIDSTISDNKAKIKELEKKMNGAEDDSIKNDYAQQIKTIEDQNLTLQNQKVVSDATQKGYQSAMTAMDSITAINVTMYSTYVDKLNTIKTNVDTYNTANILTKLSESTYYLNITGLPTYTDVLNAENNLVAECTGASIWALLKAVAGFIEALFSVAHVFDPKLGAVIDTAYYKQTYGGLPSEKDRTMYQLSYGEVGDASLSEYYQSIFGDYTSEDGYVSGELDIINMLFEIITDLGTILTNIASFITIVGLFNFAERLSEMKTALNRIINNVKSALSYLGNIFAESAIGSKILLSGYVSYMTSNRITYTGKALTGTSFNERGQNTTVTGAVPVVSDFTTLISTIQKVYSGGTEKCFVGAETEYIMFGSSSELGNQAAAFGTIYLVRVLLNIGVILGNPEVASIAAASTIAAPFVYLIYILVEPLVDTLILVNSGNIPIAKNLVYLTPTGLSSLISKFTSLKLSSAQMDQAKIGFTNAIGASKYAEVQQAFGTSTDTSDKTIFDMNYSQTLFLIMTIFTSREIMLDRLSNIIEMEAVEYVNTKVVGSNKLFDLDYSYTYIRAEGSFSMNEFIKISDSENLKSKKRIVYRGY